jgi:MFS family permease
MEPMTDRTVAEGLSQPRTPEGERAFVITPFARLARSHAANSMADAMVAASLAGSLFFSMPAGEARVPVLRYLVITMLPFAVLSPLIGPLIDRLKGGHRLMVIASLGFRAVVAWLMASAISGESITFFLYALLILVFQKSYAVARSALVPTVVRTDTELVQANSKLALISGLAGFVGVIPAGILLKLFGPEWALYLAMCTYVVGVVLATKIKPVRVADESADETERIELRGATILMAGSAMGLIRACVGFLTLLIAFDFQGGDRPTWEFAIVGGASVLSQLGGAAAGPRIREMTSEENLLTGVLALIVGGGLFSILLGGWMGAAILGSCVGFAAGGGKLAFDSILQRDAPDANRGRAFARFETRFQVTWVLGALVPVAFDLDASTGFVLVLVVAVIALSSYVMARMSYAHRTGAKQTIATARAAEIEGRMSEVSAEVRGRLGRAPRKALRRFRGAPGDDGGYAYGEHGDGHEAYEYDEYDEYDDEPRGVDAGHDDETTHLDGGYDETRHLDDGHEPTRAGGGPVLYDDEAVTAYDGPNAPRRSPARGEGNPVEGLYDDEAYGNDPDRWARPEWADDARPRVAASRGSTPSWRPPRPSRGSRPTTSTRGRRRSTTRGRARPTSTTSIRRSTTRSPGARTTPPVPVADHPGARPLGRADRSPGDPGRLTA